jgi:hypothetical protein
VATSPTRSGTIGPISFSSSQELIPQEEVGGLSQSCDSGLKVLPIFNRLLAGL